MPTIDLKVRYFQDSTPKDVPCREENFIRRELIFPLPIEQSALVLVDLWNVHHIESWVERADAMVRDVIVPLIDRARDAGLTIIQSPCPEIAAKHGCHLPQHAGDAPTWPPAEFRSRQGQHAIFRGPRAQPPGIGMYWDELMGKLDLSPRVRVQDGDFVIASGQQLHELCERRKILHLLYAGFATNWCILNRDYGTVAMSSRGYDIILFRDATEGVEFPDTLEKRWATELAVREVEGRHGFSTTTRDFYAACHALGQGMNP